MTNHFFFYSGLIFIIIHEMDAIRCKEWRIFPGLASLDDLPAFRIFIFAHIPLFFAIIWSLNTFENQTALHHGFDIFFIAHIFLHVAYIKHKNNLFKDWISWTFILGAGLFGIIDIFVPLG